MTSLKKEIREALQEADYDRVARLAAGSKRTFGVLVSLAYNKEELLCWRAIEAMGAAAKASDPDKPELLRNVVRRLIWSAREESGGMGWSAPELLGEIVCARPLAFTDIPPIIVSLHGEDEENVFRKGVLWAMGRMADAGIEDIPGSETVLRESLDSENPAVRGLAARVIGRTGLTGSTARLQELASDDSSFRIYEDGELREITVAEAANTALELVRT
ncbi:MAG: DVU0298 family protein [Thermoleophilia bacterium]